MHFRSITGPLNNYPDVNPGGNPASSSLDNLGHDQENLAPHARRLRPALSI
jgi:hypothetical protein